MAEFFKYFSGFLLIGLTIPTILILMTWNTLPNEPLYPLKRGLEQVPAMIFGIDPNLLVRYEIKLSDRRYYEAVANVQTGQTEGLKELQNSVSQTAMEIKRTSDPQVRTTLIASLHEYHQGLQKQKEIIARDSAPAVRTQPIKPANSVKQTVPAPSPTPPPPRTETVQQPKDDPPVSSEDQKTIDTINDTQSQIEQTIKDLQADAPPEVDKEAPKQENQKQNEPEMQKKNNEDNPKDQHENQSEHEKEKDNGKGDENDKEKKDK